MSCKIDNITYKIICSKCKEKQISSIYHGESGRNFFCRGLEHSGDLESLKDGKPLVEHNKVQHPDLKMSQEDFRAELTGIFKNPLERLVSEGILIEEQILKRNSNKEKIIIMNSKSDYNQPSIVKVKAIKIDYE